jgi:transposase IS66 family protein
MRMRDAVVLSDDAGQFAVGQHALCWVHAERLVHKLDTFTDLNRAAQQHVRRLIWNFYADLKAYQASPGNNRRLALRARFDRIFRRRTGFTTLDRLLARLHANKAELLMVLDRPDTPLHTNGSENDIRCQVTHRKISAGTRGDTGRDCRDAFLGLAKYLHKARRGILGLPRQSAPNSRSVHRSIPARSRPLPRAAGLILPAARAHRRTGSQAGDATENSGQLQPVAIEGTEVEPARSGQQAAPAPAAPA